jgi:hypothetical protein
MIGTTSDESPGRPALPHNTKERQEVIRALRAIGMPMGSSPSPKILHEVISDFQRAWTFSKLLIDGRAGPKTRKALELCERRDGRISRHFTLAEFESKGTDDYTIRINRALIRGLEAYRTKLGRSVTIISGYRTPVHNDNVGGASSSQHVYGNASDLIPLLTLDEVRALGKFSGIGYDQASGKVRHVDVRHKGPNTTGGRPSAPTVWRYS